MLPVSCRACWPEASTESSVEDLEESAAKAYQRYYHDRSDSSSPESLRSILPARGSFDLLDLDEEADTTAADVRSHVHHRAETTSGGQVEEKKGQKSQNPLGLDGGCVSCSISLPNETMARLPAWAPGSPQKDGKGRNGSPVMRTTEKVHAPCTQHAAGFDGDDDLRFHPASPESFDSVALPSSCHQHKLIYRTTSSPIDPDTYTILRRATVRTLSCEQLPRGLNSGALSFGDPVSGYTVAYKFRLPDPYARGGHRKYALLALAGHDQGRMYKATPIVWRAFRRIAADITARTESAILQSRTAEDLRDDRRSAVPMSSFLTGLSVDPDGYPRRNVGSHVKARGLAEMVDDELIFAHVHGEFTYLLQHLGRQIGGMSVRSPIGKSRSPDSFRMPQNNVLEESSEDD